MADFYRHCDCILSPHRGDGFGLVGLESLACGTPVIISDYHGPQGYIKEDYPYFVKGKMKSVTAGIEHFPDGGSKDETYWYFEPDKESLKYTMGMAYNQWLIGKKFDSSQYLKGLTWQQVCDIAIKNL
jgi:glycosyltransferase involved in cell wall biosynthesis